MTDNPIGGGALTPLNGEKTHPLKPGSLHILTQLAKEPMPRHEVNQGVVNRLEREALAEQVMLPSPYKTHKGAKTAFLKITDAGRKALEEEQP